MFRTGRVKTKTPHTHARPDQQGAAAAAAVEGKTSLFAFCGAFQVQTVPVPSLKVTRLPVERPFFLFVFFNLPANEEK